jgi:small subunit ribosomal protein S5
VLSTMVGNKGGKKFHEKVLFINPIAKKIKGGARRGFAVLVAVGDKRGKVGVGYGRASNVRTAIEKGSRRAKKHMLSVPIVGTTVPRRTESKVGAARVIIM